MSTNKKAIPIKKPTATRDSTDYFRGEAYKARLKQGLTSTNRPEYKRQIKIEESSLESQARQKRKGKPGYDANGYPVKMSIKKKSK